MLSRLEISDHVNHLGHNALTFWSRDDRYLAVIYVGYHMMGEKLMEIFENISGKLTSIKSMKSDQETKINTGLINNNFKIIALAMTGQFTGIKILENPLGKGDVAADFIEKRNISLEGVSFISGLDFIGNSKVAVTYPDNSDTENLNSRLSIYDLASTNVKKITEDIFAGFSSGPTVFQLQRSNGIKTYLTLGFSGFNPEENNFMAPAGIRVYQFNDGKLELKSQSALPQFPYHISVVKNSQPMRKIMIAVGTQRVQNPFKTNAYINDPSSDSFLKDDYGELRLYKFSRDNLSLMYSEHRNITTAVSFHPNGTHLAVCSIASENSSVCALYKTLVNSKTGKLALVVDTESVFTPATSSAGNFNSNGRLMVLSGKNSETFAGLHLYKVIFPGDKEKETLGVWSTTH